MIKQLLGVHKLPYGRASISLLLMKLQRKSAATNHEPVFKMCNWNLRGWWIMLWIHRMHLMVFKWANIAEEFHCIKFPYNVLHNSIFSCSSTLPAVDVFYQSLNQINHYGCQSLQLFPTIPIFCFTCNADQNEKAF